MVATPYADRPAATAADSVFMFYDIESLQNVFTVAVYRTNTATAAVYYLIDEDPAIGLTKQAVEALKTDPAGQLRILAKNPALSARRAERGLDPTGVPMFDLSEDVNAKSLANLLGGVLPKGNPHTRATCPISGLPLICDTDPNYDHTNPEHAFIAGYNSNQYDTTMLALYFSLRFDEDGDPQPVTAAEMRAHNDAIFDMTRGGDRTPMPRYLSQIGNRRASTIRGNWLSTGRHFDVARLNELQQRVALKRLLGMLGHQILESEKLSGPNARLESFDDFIDLVAYNVSDTVGTALLFADSTYSGSFDLRSGLLRTFPETVFDHTGDFRTPVQDTSKVLTWPRPRLTIDTSSAQFAGRILAPYRDLKDIPGHVADLPAVSFRYPDPLGHNGTEIGASPNVLTETRDFFFAHVPTDTKAGMDAHRAFEQVYSYYRTIEGLSFNQVEHLAHNPLAVLRRVRAALHQARRREDENLRGTLAEHLGSGDRPVEKLCDRFAAIFGAGEIRRAEDPPEVISIRMGDFLKLAADLKGAALADETLAGEERGKVLADLDRLKAFMIARADSAQPYWPQDRPATFDDTIVEWGLETEDWTNRVHELSSVAKRPCNIPYFTEAGEPTSCFATFSTGGIHGAEADLGLYQRENADSDRRWVLFRATLDVAIEDFEKASLLVDSGAEVDPKLEKIITAGREWIPTAASSMPQIEDTKGQFYTGEQLAAAAWWIRKKIRIPVVDPNTGDEVVVEWGDVLKSSSKASNPVLRDRPKGDTGAELFVPREIKESALVPPGLAHDDNRLNPKFRYTSVADVIHEDFTSYYPLMLVNLAAFTNPDLAAPGEPAPDKYSQIFGDKERYGKLRKDRSLTEAERERYGVLREGTKLILNSASGAADARHDTPILMNNMIITMRIVGQLFSWRIGQAQTFAGGLIVSTNTDGLYSTLDNETNQRVLDEHTEAIGVEIEPEELTLVSKDSNNRVEFLSAEESFKILTDDSKGKPQFEPDQIAGQPWHRVVVSAGGGTLACWNGPSPRKALAHPAMTDRLLLEYFKLIVGEYTPRQLPVPFALAKPLSIYESMDTAVMRSVLDGLHARMDPRMLLRLYQNLIASSPSASSYLYAVQYRIDQTTGKPIEAVDNVRATFPGDTRTVTDDSTVLREGWEYNRHPDAAEVQLLGHFTRVFAVDPAKVDVDVLGTPVVIGAAKARTVSESLRVTRNANNQRPANPHGVDPVAAHLLDEAGEDTGALAHSRDIILARHSGVDPSEPMLAFNHTIADHPDDVVLKRLLEAIDRDAYVRMAAASYEENWRNASR